MILNIELTVIVTALSALSGVGSYLHGRREGRLKGGFFDCLTEITLAIVAGLVIAFLGDAYKINPSITFACALVASNNGAEFLALAKTTLHKFFLNKMDGK